MKLPFPPDCHEILRGFQHSNSPAERDRRQSGYEAHAFVNASK